MWPDTLIRLPQQVLMGLVRSYRFFLSPWLGSACRFTPTCSAYALDALARHGAVHGSMLSTGRLLRCHPWCDGGLDPVPETARWPGQGLFTRLLGSATPIAPEATPESPQPFRKNP